MVFSIIFGIGALHGLFLAIVLASKKINTFPNRLLSMLMMVFSIDLGMAAFYSTDLASSYPNLIGIDYPLTLLYGPLLYLYVKALSRKLNHLVYTDLLHFIPFILLLFYMIPFYLGSPQEKLMMLENSVEDARAWWFTIINHLKIVHGVSYVGVVIYYLYGYRKNLKHTYSTLEKVNLTWLRNFIAGAVLLCAIAVILHIVSSFDTTVVMGIGQKHYGDMTLSAVTLFVYGIGYMGLNQPEVFINPESFEFGLEKKNGSKETYQKSGLNESTAQLKMEMLVKKMEEEKYYRNCDLNLAQLASIMELSPHNLTEIINRYLGKNFYDFINEYRVEEVKNRLEDAVYTDKTLLSVAFDSGFNSKSTFNSVFKKMTGTTPSQYRDRTTDIGHKTEWESK